MAPDPKLELSPRIPWSEPAWYGSLASPYYTQSHRALRERIRRYVDAHVLSHALDWEQQGAMPAAEALRFAQSGIPFGDVPERFRPAHVPRPAEGPLDAFHVMVGADEMARIEGGVAVALAGASAIGAPPIIDAGSEAQRARWLPGLFSRATSFCLGVSEPGGGSDVARIATTARRSADGAKKWITGALWATHMTTAVRTGGPGAAGISLLVIPLDAPGVTVDRLPASGQHAGGASLVLLDGVRVPADHLVGPEHGGFPILVRSFNRERFLLAVQCNRKSRTCLALAWAYALRRQTFGRPLMGSQVIRRKLAEVAHRVEAHWAWLEQLAFHVDRSPLGWQSPDIAGRVALLKV